MNIVASIKKKNINFAIFNLVMVSRWLNDVRLAKSGTVETLGSQRRVISRTDLWADF